MSGSVYSCILPRTFPYFSLNFSSFWEGKSLYAKYIVIYNSRCKIASLCCIYLNNISLVSLFKYRLCHSLALPGRKEWLFLLSFSLFYATLPGSFFCVTLKNVCFVPTLFPGLLLVFTNTLPPRYSLPPTSAPCFVFPFFLWCRELWRYSLNKQINP